MRPPACMLYVSCIRCWCLQTKESGVASCRHHRDEGHTSQRDSPSAGPSQATYQSLIAPISTGAGQPQESSWPSCPDRAHRTTSLSIPPYRVTTRGSSTTTLTVELPQGRCTSGWSQETQARRARVMLMLANMLEAAPKYKRTTTSKHLAWKWNLNLHSSLTTMQMPPKESQSRWVPCAYENVATRPMFPIVKDGPEHDQRDDKDSDYAKRKAGAGKVAETPDIYENVHNIMTI